MADPAGEDIAVCAPIVLYDEVRKQVRAMIEPLSAIWKS